MSALKLYRGSAVLAEQLLMADLEVLAGAFDTDRVKRVNLVDWPGETFECDAWVIDPSLIPEDEAEGKANPAASLVLKKIRLPSANNLPPGYVLVQVTGFAVEGNVPLLTGGQVIKTAKFRFKAGDTLLVPCNSAEGLVKGWGEGVPVQYQQMNRRVVSNCHGKTGVDGQTREVWAYDHKFVMGSAAEYMVVPFTFLLPIMDDDNFPLPRGMAAAHALRDPTAIWGFLNVWNAFRYVVEEDCQEFRDKTFVVNMMVGGGGVSTAMLQFFHLEMEAQGIPHHCYLVSGSPDVAAELEKVIGKANFTFINAHDFNRFRTYADCERFRDLVTGPPKEPGGLTAGRGIHILDDNIGGQEPDASDAKRRDCGLVGAFELVAAQAAQWIFAGWPRGNFQMIKRDRTTVGQRGYMGRHYCPRSLLRRCLKLFLKIVQPVTHYGFKDLPIAVNDLQHGRNGQGVPLIIMPEAA